MPPIRTLAASIQLVASSLAAGTLAGCSHRVDTSDVPQPRAAEAITGAGRPSCKVAQTGLRPSVVGWARLELDDLRTAIAGGNAVAVKFDGCQIELLEGCTAASGYDFQPTSDPTVQRFVVRDQGEAWAKANLGPAHIATLADGSNELEVTHASGGRWIANIGDVFVDDLRGPAERCAAATHLVQAVDVGAYTIETRRRVSGGAQAGVGTVASAGGRGSHETHDVDTVGTPDDCRSARFSATPSCGYPLRLSLTPVRDSADRPSVCPAGMQWIAGGTNGALTLRDFCLDTFEVTAAQYAECVEAGACAKPHRGRHDTYGEAAKTEHPITGVDWYAANDYCEWAGKRLPTADEWQWAAQGRDEQRVHAWGDGSATADLACFDRKAAKLGTCDIGQRVGTTRDGLHDMAGNVWEWTSTGLDDKGRRRVLMGESWRQTDARRMVAGARREARAKADGSGVFGLRCADAARGDEAAPIRRAIESAGAGSQRL